MRSSTNAFAGAYQLDSRRCISYLTIENKGAIPVELRAGLGEWLFGCDVCQDVCPWSVKFSRVASEAAFAPRAAVADKDSRTLATEILQMSGDEFSVAFRKSPMKRPKLRGLKRNAALVLGNIADPRDIPALRAALDDPEPLVRRQAAESLGRMGV